MEVAAIEDEIESINLLSENITELIGKAKNIIQQKLEVENKSVKTENEVNVVQKVKVKLP